MTLGKKHIPLIKYVVDGLPPPLEFMGLYTAYLTGPP